MTSDPAQPPPGDDTPEPVYPGVEEWVTRHFLPIYRRPLGGEYRWCSQWWRHAEAITRLTALWQSWEAMRLQPGTGTAVWLRDHLDHQLPVLLGRNGPFAQCSEDEHIEPRIAASDQPPPGWWDTGDDDSGTDDVRVAHVPSELPLGAPSEGARSGRVSQPRHSASRQSPPHEQTAPAQRWPRPPGR